MTRRWHIVVLTAILLTASALVATPRAHPGAAFDVIIDVSATRSIDVLLTTDPESLVLKLRALADESERASNPPSHLPLAEQIAQHRNTLLDGVSLRAGDQRLPLNWVGVERPAAVEDGRAGKLVVRMRGELPPQTETIQFSTPLVFGSYPLIVRRAGNDDEIQWLQGRAASAPIDLRRRADESLVRTVRSGIVLGFTHIVPKGLDHLLFILGLFLLTPRIGTLLVQVSAFTVAHTLTFAATALGAISAPDAAIEPLIAISIAFIAFENLVRSDATRSRLALIFLFGLLHGMGFAGALGSLDLPRTNFLATVVSFNIGVELAQIAVLTAAAGLVRAAALDAARYRRVIVQPVSLAIGATGIVWAIERLAS